MICYLMYFFFQDDQYSVFVNCLLGFSGYYQFCNGNCVDDSCVEDLSEEGCGDFVMEYVCILVLVVNDMIINVCFGICLGVVC